MVFSYLHPASSDMKLQTPLSKPMPAAASASGLYVGGFRQSSGAISHRTIPQAAHASQFEIHAFMTSAEDECRVSEGMGPPLAQRCGIGQ